MRASIPLQSPDEVRVLLGVGDRNARRLRETYQVALTVRKGELQLDLAELSGLDRYETITWRIVSNAGGDKGLLIRGRQKPYAPPFMMLGVNLENTTSSDFRMTFTARYLAFGVLGSGSELRVDGTLGSDPSAAFELYQPIRSSPVTFAIRVMPIVARCGRTRASVVAGSTVRWVPRR